jgi:thiol-disulfide isomerase/thioredoxin
MAVRAPDFRPRLEWIHTGGRRLSLADFRGRVLLLDFWTYGCINCLHLIPELHEVERLFPADELAVVGVHSGKFINERDTASVARACERLGVRHPVANDRQFRTWREYAVRAWPTLVVVSPDGYVLHTRAGDEARLQHAQGLAWWPAERALLVADTYNHRVKRVDSATREARAFAGSGDPGLVDGPAELARFREPGGIAVAPDGTRAYVADTNNHALRTVDLRTGRVDTVRLIE